MLVMVKDVASDVYIAAPGLRLVKVPDEFLNSELTISKEVLSNESMFTFVFPVMKVVLSIVILSIMFC